MKPYIEPFFDPATSTLSYVIYDQEGGHAAVIDAVLDFDPKAARTSTASADQAVDFVLAKRLSVEWLLETHVHADHLSAAHYLKCRLGGRIAMGEGIGKVQRAFKAVFGVERRFTIDGSQFDHLFTDGETFSIGALTAEVISVPGHTPADVAYRIGDAVFVGDTLFMPDVGTARADFPGGSAHRLYRSLRRLLSLPPETRLFVCHDYPPASRTPQWESTVAEQRAHNMHVHDGVTEENFVALREARDATLAAPMLLIPSIQVNLRAGELPPPEDNGVSYLKVPLNVLGKASEKAR